MWFKYWYIFIWIIINNKFPSILISWSSMYMNNGKQFLNFILLLYKYHSMQTIVGVSTNIICLDVLTSWMFSDVCDVNIFAKLKSSTFQQWQYSKWYYTCISSKTISIILKSINSCETSRMPFAYHIFNSQKKKNNQEYWITHYKCN